MAYKEDIRKKSSYIFWLDVLKLAKDMGIKGGKNRETFLLKLWYLRTVNTRMSLR
jgi:hypothetical protein